MSAVRGRSTGLVALGALLVFALCDPAAAAAKSRGRAHRQDVSAGSGRPAKRQRPGKGPHKSACVEAYNEAMERMGAARLREARVLAGQCAAPTCGRALRQECVLLYTRLDADIPTIVPFVADDADVRSGDVEVRMDGEVLTSKLDGRAIPVDPGLHHLTFTVENEVVASEDAMIVQGQRNRLVTAALPEKRGRPSKPAVEKIARQERARRPVNLAAVPPASPGPQEEDDEPAPDLPVAAPRPRSADTSILLRDAPAREAPSEDRARWPVYTFGTIGLLGLGGYGALTWKGRQDNQTLIESCKPDCNPASVHHIRMVYLAADASAGVGIIALTAATWAYFHSRGREDTAPKKTARVGSFEVQPASSGALATVGGTF
jgi:hypothetical protein